MIPAFFTACTRDSKISRSVAMDPAAQQVWTQGRYTNMAETWETAVRTAANTMLRYPDKISDGLEAELYALLEQLDTRQRSNPRA